MSQIGHEVVVDLLDSAERVGVAADEEVSRPCAAIVADVRRAGTPLPTNDIWIAATAARSGSLVLTYDRHFESIVGVGSVILEA